MKLNMNKILNKFLKTYMGMNIITTKGLTELASKGDHLLNPSALGKIVGSRGHQFLMC